MEKRMRLMQKMRELKDNKRSIEEIYKYTKDIIVEEEEDEDDEDESTAVKNNVSISTIGLMEENKRSSRNFEKIQAEVNRSVDYSRPTKNKSSLIGKSSERGFLPELSSE
jgi:hypothetical protein